MAKVAALQMDVKCGDLRYNLNLGVDESQVRSRFIVRNTKIQLF